MFENFDRRHESFTPGQQYRDLNGKLQIPVPAIQIEETTQDYSFLRKLCLSVHVGWCDGCKKPEYQKGMAFGGQHVCA